MKPASAKAKGQTLSKEIRDRLLAEFPELEPDDILVRGTGANGEDLVLSPAARRRFPFSIEAKFQEKISIWEAIEQSQSHEDTTGHPPILAFRRSRSERMVCLRLDDLLALMSKLRGTDKTPCGAV